MKLAIIMDPIQRIKIHKDSSFAMLLAAQMRGLELFYLEPNDLFLDHNIAYGNTQSLVVKDDAADWYELSDPRTLKLGEFDIILMRQDPPVTPEYYVTTYILEHAEKDGAWVVNKPRSLRDVNEKIYCTWFADVMSPTMVSKDQKTLLNFLNRHNDIIIKPLHSMGGDSIFRVTAGDPNTSAMFEAVSAKFSQYIMAQRYIPEITQGDKRILLINGKPVDYALARIPKTGETRGNLAAGGTGKAVALSERDKEICHLVGDALVAKGLYFVGLDVIGDYLTEINVTSPTCIRELDKAQNLDIAGDFIDFLIHKIG